MGYYLKKLEIEARVFWQKLTGEKKRRRIAAKQAFEEAIRQLKPGEWAIDLGANQGEFTAMMAETGANVIAFEPDPYAFAILKERVASASNVELINAAVSNQAGTFTLFRHKGFEKNPLKRTVSSSLLHNRRSADMEKGVEVEVVDFAEFLKSRNLHVKLLKVDIEGAEVRLLEHLFETGEIKRMTHMFVETHERGMPELDAPTRALKRRATELPGLTWNWDNHG